MVHNMPDYEFYTKDYEGSLLPEGEFSALRPAAVRWLQKLERCCRVTPYGPDSRKMALCAIAETLAVWERKHSYLEAAVGGVRVRYRENDLPLQRQLLQNASGYLDIYRGVGS